MANILVPFDFSPNAVTALDQALLIAATHNYSIEVLHIMNMSAALVYPPHWEVDPHAIDERKVTAQLVDAVEARMKTVVPGKTIETSYSVRHSVMVNGGIINHVLQNNCDLIVMGTHGATNAVERFWGSNTSTMINHALFPVLAIPPHWQPVAIREIIAAVTLKELKKRIPAVQQWSAWMGSDCEVVTVSTLPEVDKEKVEEAMKAFPEVKTTLIPKKNDIPMWRNLVQFSADRKDAVLAMFVHERTVLEKLFNYSVTSRVADGVHIPLLAIPAEHK
ncbi:universal stress protein [Flavihumibacter rivuli]|uniref:universal stress protein n=1 Tax=Flavihumibacter rivuli TaxID=2838156 RepID=UPI001BDE5A87|nr:universal stress protein [Flavihumibacter rivuli]ULQ55409.1 universal stress protein [Flavihumibacter rivuli]